MVPLPLVSLQSVILDIFNRGSSVFAFLMRGFAPARRGEERGGFALRTTRPFCFGKRTQNHWRPGAAPRGAFAPVPIAWASFDFRRVAPYAQDERIITSRSCFPSVRPEPFDFSSVRSERSDSEVEERSDSPRPQNKFAGLGRSHARRRRDVAFTFLVILDIFNRGSSVFAFLFVREEKDTGFPIGVGNDRGALVFIPMTDSHEHTRTIRRLRP